MDWFDEAKSLTFEFVAQSIGLQSNNSKKRWSKCPACSESLDKTGRPAVRNYTSNRWICNRCHVDGDTIDLISYHLTNNDFTTCQDKRSVRSHFINLLGKEEKIYRDSLAPMATFTYPPDDELKRLMEAAAHMQFYRDRVVDDYFNDRGIDPQMVDARIASQQFAYRGLSQTERSSGKVGPWFPEFWAKQFPVLFPLYDYTGTMRSFQARAVDPNATRKSQCPIGYSSGGLFFANRLALEFIQGKGVPEELWIVEGEIDFATLTQYDEIAVLGIKSGSISSMKLIRFPRSMTIYVATDNDTAGDAYAEKILRAVLPCVPFRINLKEAVGA
jgi:hypothetical protein